MIDLDAIEEGCRKGRPLSFDAALMLVAHVRELEEKLRCERENLHMIVMGEARDLTPGCPPRELPEALKYANAFSRVVAERNQARSALVASEASLAERDGLLRDLISSVDAEPGYMLPKSTAVCMKRIDAALAAKEPTDAG